MIRKEIYIAPTTSSRTIYEKESILSMSGTGGGLGKEEGDEDFVKEETNFNDESFEFSWE